MSRGPGKWQRLLLYALEDAPAVPCRWVPYVEQLLNRPLTRPVAPDLKRCTRYSGTERRFSNMTVEPSDAARAAMDSVKTLGLAFPNPNHGGVWVI